MKTLASLSIAAAVLTAAPALAQSGTVRVVDGIDRNTAAEAAAAYVRREASRRAAAKVDTVTTGSISSGSPNDARGVVVPNAEVTLGAGLAARIASMPFKDGQTFAKGDTLVTFDCSRHLADLRGAKAALRKSSSLYSGKLRLKKRGAAGGQEVRDAAADVDSAKASVEALNEQLRFCKIDAPFTGRVVERHAETHEIPAANAPVITVVDDSALELDLIVPSTWLRWVKKETEFQFAVDELGSTFPARVARLGAKVDPVSQTIKLTGTFVGRPDRVLAGMSGTASFTPPSN